MENKNKDDTLILTILDFCRSTEFEMDESDIEKFLNSDELEQLYFYSLIISFINREGFTSKKLTAKSRRHWSKTFAQLSVNAIESLRKKDDFDDFDFETEPVKVQDSSVGGRVIKKEVSLSDKVISLAEQALVSVYDPLYNDNVVAVLDKLESGGVLKYPETQSGYFTYDLIYYVGNKEKQKYLLWIANKVSSTELLNDSAKFYVLKVINEILIGQTFGNVEWGIISA